ncbi:MAG: hypothetical protein K9N49_05120 [Candidatus Marinimicrobia bacterium]|nr:hypothetical protein [Candidatus Neomarinimicrobiota bacterium]
MTKARGTEVRDANGRWLVRLATDQPAIAHLGLDTEGTGRETHNLLREPLRLSWMQSTAPLRSWSVDEIEPGHVRIRHELDYGILDWHIRADGDCLTFDIRQDAWAPVYDLALPFNLSQQHCPTAILPHAVEHDTRLQPPWLVVAPDHGHLYAEVIAPQGARRGTGKRHPAERYAPANWHATLAGQRQSHTLIWTLRADRPFERGDAVTFRFSPQPIAKPDGVSDTLWQRIRRPWLNQIQANADENDVETPMLLANNVLSNPAVCCTFFYSDAIRCLPEPLPGIDLPMLVRRTLDDWFANRVMQHGNVAAFCKSDTYLFTNPALICAAWDYVDATGDLDWLRTNLNSLNLVANFILRRDQDGDGLVESLHSGNRWSLRDPDRADFYLETVNFGHKNALTNAFAYRAFLRYADLLERVESNELAAVYHKAAAKLESVFYDTFHNPETGVLAGWISQDGEMHDYVSPYINGLACAVGLAAPEQGREILGRIMTRLRELKPEGWRWGVPVNLVPVPDYDLIQPALRPDGKFGMCELARSILDTVPDELGVPRWVDPDGTKSFRGRALYNGATQTGLTAFLIMGLDAVGMREDADWILEPLLQAAGAGELQNGLHVESGTGAEHHDWDGNPTGYEGYLPEGWYFLVAALMRANNRPGLPGMSRTEGAE